MGSRAFSYGGDLQDIWEILVPLLRSWMKGRRVEEILTKKRAAL